MPSSLFPAFVKVQYHSSWGQHVMTIPTLNWVTGGGEFASGQFVTWNDGAVEADVMINALVDEFLPFYPTSVVFDNYSIFTMASSTADPIPQYSAGFTDKDGLVATPGWSKAVQFTVNWRSAAAGRARTVLLDVDSGDNFSKQHTLTGLSDFSGILDQLSDNDLGWSAQDNSRITTFLSCTKTLNEKLRRQYRDA